MNSQIKTISSDLLFYKGLLGLIVFPFIMAFFTKACFIDAFTETGAVIIDCVAALFIIFQWYKAIKTRKLMLSADGLIIKNYLSSDKKVVPLENIISIRKVSNLNNAYYKMLFDDERRINKVYFFKNPELGDHGDLLTFFKHYFK